jgi:hypothetical protein
LNLQTTDTGRNLPRPEALLIDLDGTLLDAADGISARTFAAVRAAAKIMPVAIASGRFHEDVAHVARLLGLHSPQISDNGGKLLDAVTGRTISELPMAEPLAREIVKRLEQERFRYFAVDSARTVRSLPEFRDWRITLITCAVGDQLQAEAMAFEHNGDGVTAMCSVGSSGKWYVDYTHHEANKGYGVRMFGDRLLVDPAKILAIGDGPNDLEMLDAVGIPVAMGHASEEVKGRAVHITGTIEQDGVAQVIERFIL